MAVSGHKSEASIRSYSHTVSEERSHEMSTTLQTVARNNDAQDALPVIGTPCTSSTEREVLAPLDLNLPSSPDLNQILNTVFSPRMSSSDIFKSNKFDGCTFNFNIRQ